METEIIIRKKGGALPGGGGVPGLKRGEKLYEKIQMAIPVDLAPSIKLMVSEYKKVFKRSFEMEKILGSLDQDLINLKKKK